MAVIYSTEYQLHLIQFLLLPHALQFLRLSRQFHSNLQRERSFGNDRVHTS